VTAAAAAVSIALFEAHSRNKEEEVTSAAAAGAVVVVMSAESVIATVGIDAAAAAVAGEGTCRDAGVASRTVDVKEEDPSMVLVVVWIIVVVKVIVSWK
jgi:hypothetical protein